MAKNSGTEVAFGKFGLVAVDLVVVVVVVVNHANDVVNVVVGNTDATLVRYFNGWKFHLFVKMGA